MLKGRNEGWAEVVSPIWDACPAPSKRNIKERTKDKISRSVLRWGELGWGSPLNASQPSYSAASTHRGQPKKSMRDRKIDRNSEGYMRRYIGQGA